MTHYPTQTHIKSTLLGETVTDALLYGYHGIPENWLTAIAQKDAIDDLAERLARKMGEG